MVERLYYMVRSFEKKMRVRYYRQVKENRFLWSFVNLGLSFKRLQQASAALTYHTVFAIVPVLSLMIAIAKGLGYDEQFEQQVQSFFPGQEIVSDTLLSFATSYLNNTKVSMWLGVGVGAILLLYSVFSIFQTIDSTFNQLWNEKGRSLFTLLKTFAFVMLIPFLVVIALVMWWSVSSLSKGTGIHEVNVFLISIGTYVAILFAVYKCIPKTYVNPRFAAISALVCGCIFGLTQYFGYIVIAAFSSYRNIYGDLASLIIFLLWIYLSWTICLAGSKWSYFLQKADEQEEENKYGVVSYKYFKFICILVIERVESVYPYSGRFDTETLASNVKSVYDIPEHVTMDILRYLRLHKVLFDAPKNKLYLNPKYSGLTVQNLSELLDAAGRNVDVISLAQKIHKNRFLDNLWHSLNGEDFSDAAACLNTSVRDILDAKGR